jgi:hypothetical protein
MVPCNQANMRRGHKGLKGDRHRFKLKLKLKLKLKARLAERKLFLMKLIAVDSYLVVVVPLRISHEPVVC